jgi:GNAT superfamily N-acetyltransferase
MLITLDESHRQLVHQVRDEAGEWLATKGTDQYRGGLDMAQVHANIDHDFDEFTFVGWEVDGRVVAMMAIIDPEPDFWTPEELAESQTYISRFFVVEHGKDFGSSLLEAVAEQAGQEGKRWMRLNCWSTNTRLHQYYIKHGFMHVRTCDVHGRMSGALFQRDLGSQSAVTSKMTPMRREAGGLE